MLPELHKISQSHCVISPTNVLPLRRHCHDTDCCSLKRHAIHPAICTENLYTADMRGRDLDLGAPRLDWSLGAPAAAVMLATEFAVRPFCPASAMPFTRRTMIIEYCSRITASSCDCAAAAEQCACPGSLDDAVGATVCLIAAATAASMTASTQLQGTKSFLVQVS